MKKLLCGAVVALAVVVAGTVGAKTLAPKEISDIMKEGHKGSPALCAKASQGKASADDVKKLVELYTDLGKNKAPKGDAEAWKKKCDDLLAAAKKLAADPTDKDAVAAYKKAVNCAGCHKDHKP